jgi:hypothetical protein
VLFGVFIVVQAATVTSVLALGGDVAYAMLVLRGAPRWRGARSAVIRYLGVTLPLAGFYALYIQTGLLDPDRIHWHDAALAAFQGRLLPRVPYLPAAAREWFVMSYLSYEPVLIAGTAAIFAPGSPGSERRAADAVRRLCYALALCFVVGLAYPAMSPRYVTPALQLGYLGTGVFSRLAMWAGRHAMVPGTSFPSAHVAAVVVLMWDLWAARRGLFWIFLPLTASMTAATVLFLFHYVPDVMAAIVVGVVTVVFDRWRHPRWRGRDRGETAKATVGSPRR